MVLKWVVLDRVGNIVEIGKMLMISIFSFYYDVSKGLFSIVKAEDFFVKGFNPFPNDKILDSSKLKEFADDNFKFNSLPHNPDF